MYTAEAAVGLSRSNFFEQLTDIIYSAANNGELECALRGHMASFLCRDNAAMDVITNQGFTIDERDNYWYIIKWHIATGSNTIQTFPVTAAIAYEATSKAVKQKINNKILDATREPSYSADVKIHHHSTHIAESYSKELKELGYAVFSSRGSIGYPATFSISWRPNLVNKQQ